MKKFSLLILSLLFTHAVFATQYVIMFGGNLGLNYAPNDLNVNVGDTIVWEGDFTTNPLASVMVPEGANTFSNSMGTEYMYVVQVQGEYDYECQLHFAEGMTGKFVATNVATSTLAVNTLRPFYVVQEQGLNVLYSNFNGNTSSDVIINIYDETGNMVVGTTINPYNSRYVLPQLPSGIYFVRVADSAKPLFASEIWEP